MTSDVFEKMWEQASTRHPTGLVNTNVPSVLVLVLFCC